MRSQDLNDELQILISLTIEAAKVNSPDLHAALLRIVLKELGE